MSYYLGQLTGFLELLVKHGEIEERELMNLPIKLISKENKEEINLSVLTVAINKEKKSFEIIVK